MVEMLEVPLESIDPPPAPIRQHIPDELVEELAQSIQRVGLIEPLVCRRTGDRYEIIAGNRRWLALRRAGILAVQIVVRPDGEHPVEAVQVQENIIRQDMSPAEEARLFSKIYREVGEDIELTAARVRLSVDYVSRRMILLEGDPEVLDALDRGEISLGVADELNGIERQDYRRSALDTAVRGGCTIAVAKRWRAEYNGIARLQGGEPTPQKDAPPAAAYVPMAESVCCWFCEGTENLHTLRVVQIHDHCVDALNALLKRIGASSS